MPSICKHLICCVILCLISLAPRAYAQTWEIKKSGGEPYDPQLFAISRKDYNDAFIASEYCSMRGGKIMMGVNRDGCAECGELCVWKSREGFESEGQWQVTITKETSNRLTGNQGEENKEDEAWIVGAPEALLSTGGLDGVKKRDALAASLHVSLDNVVVSGGGAVYFVVTCSPLTIRKMQAEGFSTVTALPAALKIHPLVAESSSSSDLLLAGGGGQEQQGTPTLNLDVIMATSSASHAGADVNALSAALSGIVATRVGHPNIHVKAAGKDVLTVQGLTNALEISLAAQAAAEIPSSLWIEPQFEAMPYMEIVRGIVQSHDADSTPFYDMGLTGKGQVIGIADSGLDYHHCMFHDDKVPVVFSNGRFESSTHRKLVQYAAYVDEVDQLDGHGTHVASSAAGSLQEGVDNYSIDTIHRGVASDAKIAFYDIADENDPKLRYQYPPALHETIFMDAYRVGARIHSNSWGVNVPWYHINARLTDFFTWRHQDFLVVAAAGNSGTFDYQAVYDDDYYYGWIPDGYKTIGSPGVAKNTLTVGATENNRGGYYSKERLSSFSSRGPTSDGRIKPDVLAPGQFIHAAKGSGGSSASYSCETTSKAGTSMAAPLVAGAAALVRQYFTDGYYPDGKKGTIITNDEEKEGFTPMAALLKAVLVNSGRALTDGSERTKVGGETLLPNVDQGWGAIALADTLVTPASPQEQKLYVQGRWSERCGDCAKMTEGDTHTYKIKMATSNPSQLPLKITMVFNDHEGATYASNPVVNNLDMKVTTPTGKDILPNRREEKDGPDKINAVEHILIEGAQLGKVYTVTIEGSAIPMGPQPYALVVSGALETVDDDDFDGDGIGKDKDNCPAVSNPVQNLDACAAVATCSVPFLSYIGDGFCDKEGGGYNTAACGWDGGDCCQTSCEGGELCGTYGYVCSDPDYYKDKENVWDHNTPICDVLKMSVGDGYCDIYNNVAACSYDGGDCCLETCEGENCETSNDWCANPVFKVPACTVNEPERLGNGVCDQTGGYNTADCEWDLGDCCPETCYDWWRSTCGTADFDCMNPAYDPTCAEGYVGPDCDIPLLCGEDLCYYVVVEDVVTGDESETYCEDNFGDGWTLACPSTVSETIKITKFVEFMAKSYGWWLGFRSSGSDGRGGFSCVSSEHPMPDFFLDWWWGSEGVTSRCMMIDQTGPSYAFFSEDCATKQWPAVCQHRRDLRVGGIIHSPKKAEEDSKDGRFFSVNSSTTVGAAAGGALVLLFAVAALAIIRRRRRSRRDNYSIQKE